MGCSFYCLLVEAFVKSIDGNATVRQVGKPETEAEMRDPQMKEHLQVLHCYLPILTRRYDNSAKTIEIIGEMRDSLDAIEARLDAR